MFQLQGHPGFIHGEWPVKGIVVAVTCAGLQGGFFYCNYWSTLLFSFQRFSTHSVLFVPQIMEGQSQHLASVGLNYKQQLHVSVMYFPSITIYFIPSIFIYFRAPLNWTPKRALVLLLSWPQPQKTLEGRTLSGQGQWDPLGRLLSSCISLWFPHHP